MTQYPWPVSQVTLGNLGSHQLLASPQLDSLTGQLQSLIAAGLHSLPHCVAYLVAVEVKPPPWQLAEQRPFASSAAGNSAAAAAGGASTSCMLPVLGAFGEPLEGRDQDDSSPRASAHTGGVTGAGENRGGACWVWHPFARGCMAVEGRGTQGEVASRGPVLRAPSSAACMPPEPHPKPPSSYEGSARWMACQSFHLPGVVKALSQLGLPMEDLPGLRKKPPFPSSLLHQCLPYFPRFLPHLLCFLLLRPLVGFLLTLVLCHFSSLLLHPAYFQPSAVTKVCQIVVVKVVEQWAFRLVQVPLHQGEIPGTFLGELPGVGRGMGGTWALHLGDKGNQGDQGDQGDLGGQGVGATCLVGIPVWWVQENTVNVTSML